MIIVLLLFLKWNYLWYVKIKYFDFGVLLIMREVNEDVCRVHVPMDYTPVVHEEDCWEHLGYYFFDQRFVMDRAVLALHITKQTWAKNLLHY